MPDTSYQPDASTRMLKWQLAATFTTPGRSPDYVCTREAGIVPIGGKAPVTTTEYCNVEWTLQDGIARGYSLRGKGCP